MSGVSLLVSLGTDHHDFSRLVDYVDSWVDGRRDVTAYAVQHGYSRPSRFAHNHRIVSGAELLELIREASIVVTQGGPGSIVDVRACGRIPLVVPRRRYLHEVVDDHQVAFCEVMAAQGECHVASDRPSLFALLDRAVADPEWVTRPAPADTAKVTAAVVRRHLDSAVLTGAGWLDRARVRRLMHTGARRRRDQLEPAITWSDVGRGVARDPNWRWL